ncbi:probable G-protein coupled receptor 173 [Littorina saxatilis]|uniref:G-protein coupled receptors family 1 profile domain-containing protein n=1 Tax=Littorina saxatilis TaxID=31220 RepID=A0AAN9BAH4_9CAEN
MESSTSSDKANITASLFEMLNISAGSTSSASDTTLAVTSTEEERSSSDTSSVSGLITKLFANVSQGMVNISNGDLSMGYPTTVRSIDYSSNSESTAGEVNKTVSQTAGQVNRTVSQTVTPGLELRQSEAPSRVLFTREDISTSSQTADPVVSGSVDDLSWSDGSHEKPQTFITYDEVSSSELFPSPETNLNTSLEDDLQRTHDVISGSWTESEVTNSESLDSTTSSYTEVFHTTHLSNATQGYNSTAVFNESSNERSHSGLSSVFQDIIDKGQETISTLQPPNIVKNSNCSWVYNSTGTNETLSSFLVCDFSNSSTNATNAATGEGGTLYDVFIEEFDVTGGDDSTGAMVAKAATLALLAVVGVVGNALVIWSVVRQRHLHRPPFYYLLSLSLTDLSRAAFCLPLVLMTLLQGSVWRHGGSACDLFAFANSFFVLSSGVSLLDIAADRHLSLVYARNYRRRAGGAVNLVVVLLGWTLAFLVAFPPVVGVGAYAFEASEGQCTLRHKFFRNDNDTLGFLMVFTALMFFTLFLYYRIFLALRAHRRMRPLDHEPARSSTWTFVGPGANGQAFINWVNGFGGTNAGNLPNFPRNPPRPNLARVMSLHVARNQHVTRLFFMMTLCFHALWLPYQVLSYVRVFGSPEDVGVGFVTAAAWLSYGQVVVCPVVYFSSRGGKVRRRTSRADLSPDDKQEYLLESLHRKK